jgi:hypothetical protein
MTPDPAEFAVQLARPMGYFYLLGAAANLLAAGMAWWRSFRGKSLVWQFFAVGFGLFAVSAFCGHPLVLSEGLKTAVNAVCTPPVVSSAFFAALVLAYFAREYIVKTATAWIAFNAALFCLGASMTDPNFFAAVMRPDDVPLVALVLLLGFFLWLALRQAVVNDSRAKEIAGTIVPDPVEKEFGEKTLVWPDLVYAELICAIAVMTLLIVWSIVLPAPLEQPANPSVTPNPSKAPWYFVGLQELLSYSDAWNVGVVVPLLAIIGLVTIPYLDRNPSGSGYYSLRGRRFAILVFLFGFLQLWILPILLGTFVRGPNWSSFGLFEARDPSRLQTLTHFSLAEAFWSGMLGQPLPQTPTGAGFWLQLGYFLYRDLPGVVLTAVYFLGLPPILGRTWMKRARQSLGFARFHLMMFLLLYMMTLPLAMMCRWIFGLDSFFG